MFKRKSPTPKMPREVKISRNPWKKVLQGVILAIILVTLGVGAWVGLSANRAIKKITADGANKSSLFSFFGDLNSNIKGQSEGRTNILLLGMGGKNHPGGYLSDTMIVASINHSDKKLGLISIPRDLWVPIPGFNHAKINEAYSDGENNKKTAGSGGTLSSKTVENVLGIPIHYYLSLDFEGFKKIVDTVGGVDIYVEKDIYDPSYPADDMINYSPFKISSGLHHMDGALALKYVRSRKTTSDFDRSRRQEQVMSVVKDKILSLNILSNPKKVTELINILGEHIRTNMQVAEIFDVWNVSKTLDTANITSKVLDTSENGPLTSAQDWRGYYIYPRKGIDKFEELQVIAKNLFNTTASDQSNARIGVLNGTSKSGLAATVSELLSGYGYKVAKIADAQTAAEQTIVYDFSGGKYQALAKALALQLSAGFESKNSSVSGIDIQVVVGKDYIK